MLLQPVKKTTKNLSLPQTATGGEESYRSENLPARRPPSMCSVTSPNVTTSSTHPKAQVTSENEITVRNQNWEPTLAFAEVTDKEITASFRPAVATQ